MSIGVQTNGRAVISQIDSLDFFDAKRFMSNLGADLLFGQGIVVNSENEEIKKFLQRQIRFNKFDDLMLNIAEEVNYHGRVVLTIDKTKTGDFLFSFATPELLQNVSKIEITPFKATLLKRKVVGMQVFFQREEWTTTEVRRSITVKDAMGNQRPFEPKTDNAIPMEWQVPQYEKHNLGFVPFVEITNKPARNLILSTSNNGFDRLADDFNVRNMPIHINHGLRQMFKEEILGKTRMAGNIPLSTIKKQGGIDSLITADTFFEVDATGNGNNPIAVLAGTYDGMKWLEPQMKKINLYARGCGYSDIFASETASTEAETLYSKDANQRTTKSKRRRYTEVLNDLFAKMLVYKGLMKSLDEELPFSVEIKENVVYNQLQLVSFLKEAVESRFMTQVEAIMTQRDLDNVEDAEEIMKTINEEADEREEKQMAMFNDNNDENNDMIGKAGQGKDPDTDKEQ